MSSIPYIYPINSTNYLSPVPINQIGGGGGNFITSSTAPSLYLNNGVGYGPTYGYISWYLVNSNGAIIGQQNWPGTNNNTYGQFQLAGLCTLFFPTSGNYNIAVTHCDGSIFAIQGATIVSGPTNNNPAGQPVTPLAGYSFVGGGVAAAENTNTTYFSGTPPNTIFPTDQYVISVPSAGYYPMEFGWCSQNGANQLGYELFSTGAGWTSYITQNPGKGYAPNTVYLQGNVQAWVLSVAPPHGIYSYTYPYSFPNIQAQTGIPLYCTWPIKKTPLFNTLTRTPATGRGELRIPLMEFPLWSYELDISYLTGDGQITAPISQGISLWQQLVSFLEYVQGAGADWLFLDPFHNTATNQEIAIGDGTTTQFSMIWSLVVDGAQELVQNFVSAPSIYVNGVLQSPTTYTIDTFGTLTFDTAPPNTYPITWSGQFFYRCHFLDDFWQDLQEDWYQQWSLKLKFRSVLL